MFCIQNITGSKRPLKRSTLLAVFAFTTACSPAFLDDTRQAPDSTAYINSPFGDLNDFFNCLEEREITLISAHRGGQPENSIEGISKTLEKVPAIMEIDVATSRDGVLFLMHDDTLDRTTEGTGNIENRSWDYIRKQRLLDENGKPIDAYPPTLAGALAWAEGRTILQIDFKRSTRFENVIAEVEAADATDRVIYIAYTKAQARKLHRLAPGTMISVGLSSAEDLEETVADGIPMDKMLGWTGNRAVNAELFRLLNNRDIEVIFGTLGGRESIDNAIEENGNDSEYAVIASKGVDILATDRPVEAYNALNKSGRALANPVCGVYPAGAGEN